MKKLIFLFSLLYLAIGTYAQLSKTINLPTAGTLSIALTPTELQNVTNLTITGNIDAHDFKTMRDSMPLLSDLDLGGTTVVAYIGTDGPYNYESSQTITYPANAIPIMAFSTYGNPKWSGKTSLHIIVLPSLTTSIGWSAFNGCIGLTNFNIPSSVTSISGSAFKDCTGLTSITIPSSVKVIENNVFNGCKNLTRVTIPSSVTVIETYAFLYCSSLTSADLPSQLIAIRNNAFAGCVGLTKVTIPSSVTSIGTAAFSTCSGLTSITVSTQIPLKISLDVFNKTDKTTCTLNVPIGSKSAYQADSQWGLFTNIVEIPFISILSKYLIMFGNTTTMEISSSTIWIAKSDQDWLTLTTTGAAGKTKLTFNAEENNTGQTRTAIVTVSVDGFDDQFIAFNQYKKGGMTPGSLNEIYKDILRTVSNLTLTGTMDARDFKTLRDTMYQVSQLDLSGVTIAAYTGKAGTAFNNATVNYPENTIPEYAFSWQSGSNKTNPTEIILPTSIISIGRNAFKGCTGLSVISIPNSVTTIGLESFMNCSKLSSIFIPASVKSIERMAFWGDNEIIVDESSPYYSCTDGILFNKNHTDLLQFPRSISGDYKIPSTVTSILGGAFWNCKLNSITIPSSVNSIGGGAFESTNVYNLNNVTVWWPVPLEISSLDDIFRDYAWGRHHSTLYVPYGTVSLYAASPWNGFGKIVEMSGLKLSETTATVKTEQGSIATIDISSDILWTARSDQSWLTVSPSSGSGVHMLTFTATGNPNNTARTAIVTVLADGIEPQIITITQDAITGIGPIVQKQNFAIYPNPTSGKVKLVFDKIIPNASYLEVYDVAGQLILKQNIQNQEEWIDLKGNAPGVYLIKTNLKDYSVQKVILR